jgi:hypothetical protein
MSPEQFQQQLAELPADTPVTAQHILAMLEILRNASKPQTIAQAPKDQNYSKWDDQKVIDQDTLAEWINESPSTLEKWRMTNNTGPQATYKKKRVGYQVGKVREWLNQNTHDSNVQHQHAKQAELQAALTGKKIKKLFYLETELTGFEVRWNQTSSLAYWFNEQLIYNPEKAVARLEVRGNINEVSLSLVSGEVQKRTLAHTVATLPYSSQGAYQDLIVDLLNLGVDFTAVDEQGRDAVKLAEHLNNECFARTVRTYNQYWELQEKLGTKPAGKLRKQPF